MAYRIPDRPTNRQFTGSPVTVGTRTLTPVIKLTGWATRDPDDALLNAEARFRPVAVSVREADGSSYRVVLPNGTAWLVGLLLASGMAVILVCQWIIHRAKQERVGVPGSRITRPDFAATVQPRREYDVPL